MLEGQLGRIRTRLLVVNLMVLLVPVVGLEFARIYERQLLSALQRDMKNQAVLVRELVEDGLARGTDVGDASYERVLTESAKATRTRIRLLDASGATVGDSHRAGPPEGDEPPAPRVLPDEWSELASEVRSAARGETWAEVPQRKEVRSALAGIPDAFTRLRGRDPSVLLFLAEPIRHQGDVRGVVYVTRSTQPVLIELYRIRTGLIKVLLVAIAFTILLSVLLGWTISRPLGRLSRAARAIAGGRRDVKVPLAGSGEIRELAEAFHTMTERLDARLRYISEFAADVTHEFKSPITSIRGAAELLIEGAAEDADTRERFLRNIQLDADRMDRLVSRLLELSRIEASDEPMQEVDLADIVARVVERTHSAEQPVEVHAETNGTVVYGRPGDLERALLNLVENALRFSPPSQPVTVELAADSRHLRISVCDRGEGVPEAHREKIFERFFTTDAERSGTGLGLAIVRSVASAHGGRVELESSSEPGACFRVSLPRARPFPPPRSRWRR